MRSLWRQISKYNNIKTGLTQEPLKYVDLEKRFRMWLLGEMFWDM
jgi:hypothetical protein